MGLTTQDRILIEARLANEGPSMFLAFVLWAFLGLLGVHRFYLGRPVSAIFQIITVLALIGILWAVLDVFFIPSMVRAKRERLRQAMTVDALALAPA